MPYSSWTNQAAALAEDTKMAHPGISLHSARMLLSNGTKCCAAQGMSVQMHATMDGGLAYSLYRRLASHGAGGCLQQFGKSIL